MKTMSLFGEVSGHLFDNWPFWHASIAHVIVAKSKITGAKISVYFFCKWKLYLLIYLLFGRPMVNFWQLFSGHCHSPNVNHWFWSVFNLMVAGSLIMSLSPWARPSNDWGLSGNLAIHLQSLKSLGHTLPIHSI